MHLIFKVQYSVSKYFWFQVEGQGATLKINKNLLAVRLNLQTFLTGILAGFSFYKIIITILKLSTITNFFNCAAVSSRAVDPEVAS